MTGAKAKAPTKYDGDAKLFAFLGAVGFILAVVFWGLIAFRLFVGGAPHWPLPAAASLFSLFFVLIAWGARTRMQFGVPVSRWDIRTLLLAGLVLGIGIGGLPYLVLRYKLEDPEFIHLASQAENLPPAFR